MLLYTHIQTKIYKRIKQGIFLLLLSGNIAYCNMPVFDFSNLTQAILDYQEQIKEMIMFEKQLQELGIDVDRISGFISDMQGAWDSLQNLNEQALNLSGIESLLDTIKSDCDELQNLSTNFSNYINEQKKKLKGMSSKEAEKQACMNALLTDEFSNEVAQKKDDEAQQAYEKDDRKTFLKKIHEAEQIRHKQKQNRAKMQEESVQKVLNAYNSYVKGSASGGESKYNMLYRKDTQEMMSKIQKQLSVSKIRGMNEKEREEALLRVQSMMLQVLVSQYEVMQSMNAMYASLAMESVGNTKDLKEFEYKERNIPEFKKNALGYPDFAGEIMNKGSGKGGIQLP